MNLKMPGKMASICRKHFKSVLVFALVLCAFVISAVPIEKAAAFETVSAAAQTGASTSDESTYSSAKISYEELSNGSTMYCTYFGVLNVRSEADQSSDLVGMIAYKDEVTAYCCGYAVNGYVRVSYVHPHTGETMTGYCLAEYLSDEAPDDERIYLAVIRYMQTSSAWADIRLGSSYETIASAGCTTTCLAMSYSYITGNTITPADIEEMSYYTSGGEIKISDEYIRYYGSDYLKKAYEQLCNDIPVLLAATKGNGEDHWVLITGYSGDGTSMSASDFVIHDPADRSRSTVSDLLGDYPYFLKIVYYGG